jgi:hypothetical protein
VGGDFMSKQAEIEGMEERKKKRGFCASKINRMCLRRNQEKNREGSQQGRRLPDWIQKAERQPRKDNQSECNVATKKIENS